MAPPARTPKKTPQSINLDSARLGLNRPGNGEVVAFLVCIFFGIMASGGILRHH
jgi:hypothetical protein